MFEKWKKALHTGGSYGALLVDPLKFFCCIVTFTGKTKCIWF